MTIQERTLHFGISIVTFARTQSPRWSYDPLLRELVRSATSIGANVAEGQGGSSRKDFCHFLTIARKSAYETRYWLLIIQKDRSRADKNGLFRECEIIYRILTSIILQLRRPVSR